jgi:hypothetical protein
MYGHRIDSVLEKLALLNKQADEGVTRNRNNTHKYQLEGYDLNKEKGRCSFMLRSLMG